MNYLDEAKRVSGAVQVPAVHIYQQGLGLVAKADTLANVAATLAGRLGVAMHEWPGDPDEIRDVILQQPSKPKMMKPSDLRCQPV